MAKAYRLHACDTGESIEIYGHDINSSILEFAKLDGTLDGALDDTTLPLCELVFISLYPVASIQYLRDHAHLFSPDSTVIDLCGTKQDVCRVGFELALKHGFTFVGGHPMAGTHKSGYKYSKAGMFRGAPMVIVPKAFDNARELVITAETFAKDALIFDGIKSKGASVIRANGKNVHVAFDAPCLGIWAKPAAPYVCIEPWHGIDDMCDAGHDITKKERIEVLGAGETWVFPVTITAMN
jgi:hypothetical protein